MQLKTPDHDPERTVIIANGFLPFPRPMGHIKAAYASAGFRPHVVPFTWIQKFDVRWYALDIADAIRREARYFGRQVDVVGTSMGGLCTFYALTFCGVAPLVRTAVAAAAPFKGSIFTLPGRPVPLLGNSARQMTPGSSILQEMRWAELPVGPRYVTLAGTGDWVCPQTTAEFVGTESFLWPCGHLDLMFRAWVHARIAQEILSH